MQPILNYVAYQAERNAADEKELALIKATGVAVPLGSRELLPRLRYQDPIHPTEMEKKLITAVRSEFLDLMTDMNSYQQKPAGCGCAGKIQQALSQRKDQVQQILDTVYGPGIYTFVAAALPPPAFTLVGTTAIIPATPEAWTAYFAKITRPAAYTVVFGQKQLYNGVHVKEISDGKQWMLLFY